MKSAFSHLLSDFLSSIVFTIVYVVSHDIAIATGAAVAVGVGQFAIAWMRHRRLHLMTVASLVLVIVLGTTSLLLNDPRFVLMKPAIGHLAIAVVMLKRGWMLRYMPDIVRANVPERVIVAAGYCWAAMMLMSGAATIAAALTGDMRLWLIVVSAVLPGIKIAAFGVQFLLFRMLVRRSIIGARRAAARTPDTASLAVF